MSEKRASLKNRVISACGVEMSSLLLKMIGDFKRRMFLTEVLKHEVCGITGVLTDEWSSCHDSGLP